MNTIYNLEGYVGQEGKKVLPLNTAFWDNYNIMNALETKEASSDQIAEDFEKKVKSLWYQCIIKEPRPQEKENMVDGRRYNSIW